MQGGRYHARGAGRPSGMCQPVHHSSICAPNARFLLLVLRWHGPPGPRLGLAACVSWTVQQRLRHCMLTQACKHACMHAHTGKCAFACSYSHTCARTQSSRVLGNVVPPAALQTADGQLVEVEDDDEPTDSDDESSDDGAAAGAARRRARSARQVRRATLRPARGLPALTPVSLLSFCWGCGDGTL